VRKFARLALEAKGYRVLTAGHGQEALKMLEDAGIVHLVLTDVIMPVMSGVALARHLHERFPSLPILFISGFAEHPEVNTEILEMGMSILQKPFSPYELSKKVREVLDGAGMKAKTKAKVSRIPGE